MSLVGEIKTFGKIECFFIKLLGKKHISQDRDSRNNIITETIFYSLFGKRHIVEINQYNI